MVKLTQEVQYPVGKLGEGGNAFATINYPQYWIVKQKAVLVLRNNAYLRLAIF